MGRRLTVLLATLAVLVAASFAFLRFASLPSATSASRPKPTGPLPTAAQDDPAGYDKVTVKITIPPLSSFPAGWAEKEGCAHTRLSGTLGAVLSQGNGVIVFAVAPGKPAAKAGLAPGDRLGDPGACPSTLVASFAPREKARTISWTIRRPRTAALRQAAAREAKQARVPALPAAAEAKANAAGSARKR